MPGLIEFIARNIVDDPDGVSVRELRNDRYATVVELRVSVEDLGKVIGRQGRVAKAMRTLMRASGALHGKRHMGLEIDDQGTEPPTRAAAGAPSDAAEEAAPEATGDESADAEA